MASQEIRISQDGIKLIEEFEGFSAIPYCCPAGVPTIGFGHTDGVTMQSPKITKAQGRKLLKQDCEHALEAIERYVKVDLSQNQIDALVSFIYNLGAGAFRRSTLLKKINQSKFDEVPYELMRWNKVGNKVLPGLTRRRAAEVELWLSDEPEEAMSRGDDIRRDVPTIINTENVTAVIGVGGIITSSQLEANNPMAWAIAIIALGAAALALYLFLRRRGA